MGVGAVLYCCVGDMGSRIGAWGIAVPHVPPFICLGFLILHHLRPGRKLFLTISWAGIKRQGAGVPASCPSVFRARLGVGRFPVNTRPLRRGGTPHIILRNSSLKSSTVAALGLPGAQASSAADWARKSKSSSFIASSLVGMPTSTDNCRTASMAALR